MDLHEVFEKHNDDFIKFERVENKKSQRPDLHAFLLLDELCPGTMDMVSAAEHDEIWLDVDCEELAKVITEDQVLELTRCGVHYDSGYDALKLFV
jgi:hypothetical protein